MAEAPAVPDSVTVAPLPPAAGLIVPDNLQVWVPVVAAGRISQMARLNRSVVGYVSLMLTEDPLSGVGLFCT